LAIWDRQLVEEGAYLIARRAETIARYNQLIGEIHPRLTDQREQLRLVYQPNVPLDVPTPLIGEIIQRFHAQLESLRPRELGAAVTLVGPHRDDIRFLITRNPSTVAQGDANAMDATTYASRGQGRTIALALKLAEVALMRAETGEEPILLLDDVMSELDAARRAALAQAIIEAPQALVTTTDPEEFSADFRERARVLQICEGKIL
jgi:DNA replication and repair protein RecF